MNIKDLFQIMVDKRASDLHLKEGRQPLLRIDGRLAPLDMDILSNADLREMIYAISDEKQRKKFEESNEMDLAYNYEGVARFRANVFRQMGKLELVLRAIPIKIPTLEDLNLPPSLSEISLYQRGLVLVTGTTGSGKSTTLAAMINKVNENYNDHIVTIEDPIEFVHIDKKCSVSQREIGLDTENFKTALKYVLRQDPDVILIGEMRDAETVGTAISAAETGHMVFSTLHTMDAIQTINRILDFFEKEQQKQVAIQLSEALRAVVSLRLVVKADGVGRVPACEVMVVTPTVRGYIEELKISMIRDLIRDGEQFGMQTFDQSLINLYKRGLITVDEAKKNSTSPQEIDLMLKGITSSKASAQSILDSMLKEQQKKEFETMYRQARNFASSGRYKEAMEVFEKLAQKYPTSKEVAEGMESMRMMINADNFKENVKAIMNEGLNIYRKGNIKGAIIKWQEALDIDANNAQIKAYIQSAQEKLEQIANIPKLMNEGLDIYKTGKIAEAIAKWKEVLKVDPANMQAQGYVEGAEQKLKELKLKQEIDQLYKRAQEEAASGNELQALSDFKRAMLLKPNAPEMKKSFDDLYNRMIAENSGGGDVESALTAESFKKGMDYFLAEEYLETIKEWKKAVEKRPLEKKLKEYIEKTKEVFKRRLEGLTAKVEEAYMEKRLKDAVSINNAILRIDPTNQFAIKFMSDTRPRIEEETQNLYKQVVDDMTSSRFKEAKARLEEILALDPNNMMAKKRLEEVNVQLSSQR